tara:strand:- start:453 stop:569 length:117 start_codon:yes stop_codon:yes gene_type:complete
MILPGRRSQTLTIETGQLVDGCFTPAEFWLVGNAGGVC